MSLQYSVQEANVWAEIAVCNRCGSSLEVSGYGIRCTRCGEANSLQQGWLNLTCGELPSSPARIVGQMTEPSDFAHSAMIVRSRYLPVIEECGIPLDDLRILEIGSGLGFLAQGFSQLTDPRLYLATDPFGEVLPRLRAGLDAWGLTSPRGLVAAIDADKPIAVRESVVNLVLFNSVLHHVLDYRSCIKQLARLIDRPGAIICIEPCVDGWAYYAGFISLVLSLAEPPYRAVQLTDTTKTRLRVLMDNLNTRMGNPNDVEYLATLDDKHIFSFAALRDVAEEADLRFHAFQTDNDPYGQCMGHLSAFGIAEEDRQTLGPILRSMLPPSARYAEFSDLVKVLCFRK